MGVDPGCSFQVAVRSPYEQTLEQPQQAVEVVLLQRLGVVPKTECSAWAWLVSAMDAVELLVTWIMLIVALVGAYKFGIDAGKLKESKPKGEEKNMKEEEANRKSDDWEWPVYDSWWSNVTDRYERKLRVKEKGKPDSAPFEIIYEQERGWPDDVTVKLRSRSLIQVVKQSVTRHFQQLITVEPEINGREMFIELKSFKQAEEDASKQEKDDTSKEVKDETSLLKYDLKHLIRFLETEYKDTIVHAKSMRRRNMVSWELLWIFLHKGARVYYTCAMTGQKLLGDVWHYSYYEEGMTHDKFFYVQIKCFDFNGTKYVKRLVDINIPQFKSENSFESIGICPLNLLEESEVADLEKMFLRNGTRFYNTVKRGSCYMEYKGPRLYKEKHQFVDKWDLKKQKADGRVMVDLLSFARMNPGYPLKDAEPWSSSSPHTLTSADTETPSNEYLMLAPAVVYGFSFANKKWGGFDITRLSEIQFQDEAFDSGLVLDASRKQMLLALVKEFLRNPNDAHEGVTSNRGVDDGMPKLDPISNKGEGCIFLCYGPPGTGKTLTAESMAEKLHRPLWAINVFELGRTPEELEMKLIDILAIAWQWRAVLLLDEADIYMERRTSSGDPNRTAMTAIFLRLVEYYRGVLFLTTNRVATFDDAFCSRISMFLRYHRLGDPQREAIWRNLFARAGVANPDLTPFRETQLNGREIRNTIRIAQAWAKSSGEKLTTEHVLTVVKMLGEFCQDLEGAIQHESDERSISHALQRVSSMQVRDSELNSNFAEAASTNES